MTMLKQQAMEMIERMPEDKVYYIINILQGFEGLFGEQEHLKHGNSQDAYKNLQKFRKVSTEERDYKSELRAAMEEKYANLS